MKCFRRLICLSIIGLIIYSGAMFAIPYYRHFAFKSDAESMIRFPISPQGDNRLQLMRERAKELKVPLTESGVVVTGSGNDLKVTFTWTETVNILNIYKKNLDFTVKAIR
ncbi:MAG: hypothetical protein HY805_03350 [Nitrospirae bacterium]|nr:hypothetical protein [Nitrospirota bacterium]